MALACAESKSINSQFVETTTVVSDFPIMFHTLKYITLHSAIFTLSGALVNAEPNPIAGKPPLGWNSYDCFGSDVTEAEIRENAAFMAEHLKPAGWEYVVVDFCWSHPAPGACANPHIGKGMQPLLHVDLHGRLIPAPNRFPSSGNVSSEVNRTIARQSSRSLHGPPLSGMLFKSGPSPQFKRNTIHT